MIRIIALIILCVTIWAVGCSKLPNEDMNSNDPNNIQNEQLTFHTASRRDWWFHVKGLPGTHVILKTKPNEEMPSDNAVLEAASLAAYFSKTIILEEHMTSEDSRPGQLKAEVDYCPISHVKKIPGAKPGMVIYEGYYSVFVEAKEPSDHSSKDL